MKGKKVKWAGRTDLVLFQAEGMNGELDGPIGTIEQYVNGENCCAYLRKDGVIMQEGEVVGVRSEVEIGEEVNIPPMSKEGENRTMLDFLRILATLK